MYCFGLKKQTGVEFLVIPEHLYRSRKSRSHPPHKSLRVGDPETGSVGSGLGTLRRAHIDRTKVSRTSFYLRVGALGKQMIFYQN